MKKIVTEFFGTGTLGERGQIVIPAEARSSMNINPGDKFVFVGHGPILHIMKAEEMDNIFNRIHDRFEKALGEVKKMEKNKYK